MHKDGWRYACRRGKLTLPRNGTLGLYNALQILGYNPYHLKTAFEAGAQHLRVIREGMAARMDGDGEPYGREEFDKLFADNGVPFPPSLPPSLPVHVQGE